VKSHVNVEVAKSNVDSHLAPIHAPLPHKATDSHHVEFVDDHALERAQMTKSIHKYTSFQGEKVTLKVVAISMWNLAIDKRMLFLSPQLFWTGISIAYFSGVLADITVTALPGVTDSE
jgi:hypothetical protein